MKFSEFLIEFTSKNIDSFMSAFKSVTERDPHLKSDKIGYFKSVYISLIPYRYSGRVHIEEIKAMEMGTGVGTKAMDLLCRMADKYQVPLTLHVVQLRADGPSKAKLIEFYNRLNFKVTEHSDDHMERMPKDSAAAHKV